MRQGSTTKKPEVSSKFAQSELDKADAQFQKFNDNIKSMTADRMNEAPLEESAPQTKISNKELQKDGIWLKPVKTISSKEKFNETYRKVYEFAKEYVKFIAENKEIIGESIHMWTKGFPGQDAEYWEVPTNKPVYGPRYLAEQIKKARYHRLTMEDRPSQADGMGTYYGVLAADKTIQRLDAYPVNDTKSVFMGAGNF